MSSSKNRASIQRPVALITGAYRGIGRAIALKLAERGFHITGVDVLDEPVGLRNEIETNDVDFQAINADIAWLEDHERIVNLVIDRFGRLDILVNNAGVAPLERKDILDITADSFERVISVNLHGAFFLTQIVSKWMVENSEKIEGFHPRIVFITSISAEVSSINRAEYCISKAGLSMTTKLFADRLAKEGIMVFEVRPGIIRTDMTEPAREKYDRLIKDGLIPQGRWGYPEDVAKTVAALTDGSFDYSTGAVIEVSGGMNIQRL